MRALTGASEIGWAKVVGRLKRKVINKPAVSEGAECHKSNAKLLSSLDEAVCLMDSLESRVLSLDGINLRNCKRQYLV